MLDKFWESLGEDLAGEWLKRVFSPAFLFWAGGLGMYLLRYGWREAWTRLSALPPLEQGALVALVLLVLILSSLLMQFLRFDLLRLLEGYWPAGLGWLAEALAERQEKRLQKRGIRWNDLKGREETLTRRQARQLAELEARLHYFPTDPKHILPTALGNILRAAETAPFHKYGLDAFVCWPRLWLLLPAEVRQELVGVRAALMERVELWAWGLLFLLWMAFSPWALGIAALWLLLAQRSLLQAGMAYADMLEATFDLHRWKLYEAARWPLPASSDAEAAAGQRLSESFWRGTAESPIQYQ